MKRLPSHSVAAMLDAHQAVREGDIEPPAHVKLTDADYPFWLAVVRARARKEWTDADLIHAANMARCMRQIEDEQAMLDVEGTVIRNERGTMTENPRCRVLTSLSSRAMSLTRLLQMQAASTGAGRDKVRGRELERAAREAADEVAAEASLLA